MRIEGKKSCGLAFATAMLVSFSAIATAQSNACTGTGYFSDFNYPVINVDQYTASLSATLDANTDGVGAGTLTCTTNVVAGQGQHYLWLRYQEYWFDTVNGTGPLCGAFPCADTLVLTISGSGVSDTTTLSGDGTTTPLEDAFSAWVIVNSGGFGQVWGRTVTRTIDVSSQTLTAAATYQFQLTQTFPSPGAEATAVYGTFSVGRSAQLIDPVIELISNNEIVQDPETLATLGTPVVGVSADSASKVVIKIRAQNPGQTVTVTIYDDKQQESSNPAQDGTVSIVNGTPASSATLTAVNTNEGPMAFGIYQPPSDFNRGSGFNDSGATTRSVSLQWQLGSAVGSSLLPITESAQLAIWRPPVIMVHGAWSDSSAWNNFTPFMNNVLFSPVPSAATPPLPWTVDYGIPITGGVTVTSPNFDWPGPPNTILTSALGFAFNAPAVLTQIQEYLVAYRFVNGIAATQADVVAHSMGGTITRALQYLASYTGPESFGKGNVHKLITIGTPHLGSPLATQMLADDNQCARTWLGVGGTVAINIATVAGVPMVSGAAADLQGPGLTGIISPALSAIQPMTSNPVPTAMIAGMTTQQANLQNVGTTPVGRGVTLCGDQSLKH